MRHTASRCIYGLEVCFIHGDNVALTRKRMVAAGRGDRQETMDKSFIRGDSSGICPLEAVDRFPIQTRNGWYSGVKTSSLMRPLSRAAGVVRDSQERRVVARDT